MAWTGKWSWTAQRLAISAFLVFHLTANLTWVMPLCPVRQQIAPIVRYYILPLGLWQFWAMFAPDPVHDSLSLEAEVIDCRGMRYLFSFPKLADYNWWQGIPRFRYSKYAANLVCEEFGLVRRCAARHVLRHMKLPPEVFPVSVHLLYQVRPTPPPESAAPQVDPMSPTKPYVVGTVRIDSPGEVYQ